MSTKQEISQSEWQVMNVVWQDQPVTASEIIKRLQTTHEWTPATIRTFLHRLVKKNALEFEEDGNRYVYRAATTRNSSIKQASKTFLKSVFGGESGPLIAHFVKSSRLSDDEIRQLRELLEKKEGK